MEGGSRFYTVAKDPDITCRAVERTRAPQPRRTSSGGVRLFAVRSTLLEEAAELATNGNRAVRVTRALLQNLLSHFSDFESLIFM